MSAQQQPVKVTLQSQRAGDSAKHNDRTMYRNGYFNELAPQDGLTNYHWSQETMGIGSEAREREVYEALFSEKVVQINESRKKHYRKDVYDLENPRQREQALEEYRWKHPPRETIFQIGSMDNPIDRAQAKEILLHQGKRLEEMDSEHFVLLSYDIHMDEGSPHMHARYLMLDERGEVNAEGGLRALGVEPPVSYDKWAKEQNEKRAQRAEKNGKQYKTVKAKSSTNNNRLMTFTKNMRESFEGLVEEYGISINTHRTRKKHLTQRAEKAERERAQAERQKKEDIDRAEASRAYVENARKKVVAEKRRHQDEILEIWKNDLKELERRDKEVLGAVNEEKQIHFNSINELQDELAKLRKENKEKEGEYEAIIRQEQSKLKETQNNINKIESGDISDLNNEISLGKEALERAKTYNEKRDAADNLLKEVKETITANNNKERESFVYRDKYLSSDWFNRQRENISNSRVRESKKQKVLDKLKEAEDLWKQFHKEDAENPLHGKTEEEMDSMYNTMYTEPGNKSRELNNKLEEYYDANDANNEHRKPKPWIPPSQQDQEKGDDDFEFDF